MKHIERRLTALERNQPDNRTFTIRGLQAAIVDEIEAARRDDGSIEYSRLSDSALRDILDHVPTELTHDRN